MADCGWPAFNVERWAASKLKPYKGNARTHSEAQVAQIAASIQEWGWTQPILIDGRGGVIAGHGRLLAAQSLGVEEVPVIIARGWSSAQKRAYILADNQLTLNAGWDEDLLRVEIAALGEMGFDIPLLGFGDDFLAGLLGKNAGLTDPDDAPAAPVNPVTRLGDLWALGAHRVLCGDATKAENVERALGGGHADLCLTDPPYGVGEIYPGYNDTAETLEHVISGFLPIVMAMAKVVLITPGNSNQTRYPKPDWTLAWFVPAGIGRCGWGFTCWQPILAFGKDPYLARGKGARPDALCLTESADNSLGHPCPKPIKVWKWLMERGSSRLGETVLDPFLGSGTTIIAAEMGGRSCLGLEISPAYVDVAVERWQNFTGEAATLEGDGRTFAEIESERKAYAEAAE